MQIAAGFGLETCDLNNEADPQAALQEIINRPVTTFGVSQRAST